MRVLLCCLCLTFLACGSESASEGASTKTLSAPVPETPTNLRDAIAAIKGQIAVAGAPTQAQIDALETLLKKLAVLEGRHAAGDTKARSAERASKRAGTMLVPDGDALADEVMKSVETDEGPIVTNPSMPSKSPVEQIRAGLLKQIQEKLRVRSAESRRRTDLRDTQKRLKDVGRIRLPSTGNLRRGVTMPTIPTVNMPTPVPGL